MLTTHRYEPTSRPPLVRPDADLDVAIVGAGAAGIAAARACLRLGLRAGLFEARNRVGGRAVTAALAGHPVDMGAHWMHAGALNPLLGLARARGDRVRRASGSGGLFVAGRRADRAERQAYGRSFERIDAAITAASRQPPDRAIGAVLPPLGRWREPAVATFDLVSGRPVAEVSAADFPSEEFGDNHFVRGGYGALLARLAAGLPVALGCPVTAIERVPAGVLLTTGQGRVRARAVIVTVPMRVLAAGAIAFRPVLPAGLEEAIGAFMPATYEHVVLNWPDPPFRGEDRLVKLVGSRRSHGLMGWMDAAPFHYLELGPDTVASAGRPGGTALARLVRTFLADQFGTRAVARARVLAVTDWLGDPWSRGAWAVVRPGRVADRERLHDPVEGRIWFAGEANIRAQWGTVGGAWTAGEAAAEAAARALAAV